MEGASQTRPRSPLPPSPRCGPPAPRDAALQQRVYVAPAHIKCCCGFATLKTIFSAMSELLRKRPTSHSCRGSWPESSTRGTYLDEVSSADYNQDNLAPPFSTRNVTLQKMPSTTADQTEIHSKRPRKRTLPRSSPPEPGTRGTVRPRLGSAGGVVQDGMAGTHCRGGRGGLRGRSSSRRLCCIEPEQTRPPRSMSRRCSSLMVLPMFWRRASDGWSLYTQAGLFWRAQKFVEGL